MCSLTKVLKGTQKKTLPITWYSCFLQFVKGNHFMLLTIWFCHLGSNAGITVWNVCLVSSEKSASQKCFVALWVRAGPAVYFLSWVRWKFVRLEDMEECWIDEEMQEAKSGRPSSCRIHSGTGVRAQWRESPLPWQWHVCGCRPWQRIQSSRVVTFSKLIKFEWLRTTTYLIGINLNTTHAACVVF